MANLARFTIAGTPSSQGGYDVSPGSAPTLALEASSQLVGRWTVEVHSSAPGAPRATTGAPTLTLNNGTSTGQAVDATTPSSTITVSAGIPSVRAPHLWEVRSKVNGGTNPDGSVNPDYVFSRFIAMRNSSGLRKIMLGERNEYSPTEAWAEALNGWVDAVQASPLEPWTATYGPTSLPLSAGEAYHAAVSLPAPTSNATVIDYVVRVHARQTSQEPLDAWDESVVVRVSRDDANTSASIVGGYRQFNDAHLRLSVSGLAVILYVRSDPNQDWTYTVLAERVPAVPFDGHRTNVHEQTIGTGSNWVPILRVPIQVKSGLQTEVEYTVRGRFNTTPGAGWSFIRAKGAFALECSNMGITLVDQVSTWGNARIRVNWPGGGVYANIEVQQHATQNWLVDAEMTLKRIGD